jgi:hypothetical protein
MNFEKTGNVKKSLDLGNIQKLKNLKVDDILVAKREVYVFNEVKLKECQEILLKEVKHYSNCMSRFALSWTYERFNQEFKIRK